MWHFECTPSNGDGVHNYGELTKIVPPTGGYIKYSWVENQDVVCVHSYQTASISSVSARTLNDGLTDSTWTYNGTTTRFNSSADTWYPVVATIQDPLGNKAIHTLSFLYGCSAFETSTEFLDSQGTSLKTVKTAYQELPHINIFNTPSIEDNPVEAALPSSVMTTVGAVTKEVDYQYDAGFSATGIEGTTVSIPYGNVASITEFDYGTPGGGPGRELRSTTNTYLALVGSSPQALTLNILDSLSSQTITDAVTGKQKVERCDYDQQNLAAANADIEWDSSPPNGLVRGNRTTITDQIDQPSGSISKSYVFTGAGEIASITDARNNITSFEHLTLIMVDS